MRFRLEGSGKGDKPRPVNKIVFDANWIRAFGSNCSKCNGEGIIFSPVTPKSELEPILENIELKSRKCEVCKGIGKVGK